MRFDTAPVPHGMSVAEKNASPAGKQRRVRYRQKLRAERPFVAWDGEGVTRDNGDHDYVLLANSLGHVLSGPDGLGTADVFDFVLRSAAESPDAIHIIYGGGYDFNKWFTDFTRDELESVYRKRFTQWHGYRLGWRRGKSLYLADEDGTRRVTVYDVVSFFQSSFVAACDSYLGEAFTNRNLIVENKAIRSAFTVEELPEIVRYNAAELENLVALMGELRTRLYRVGLYPARWDGPGAIATSLMKQERIHDHRCLDVPVDVGRAARVGYAGGRFEVVRFGHVDAPAYEYDINSAYPAALRAVPSLSVGRWDRCVDDPGDLPYALYRVRLDATAVDWSLPFPLFHRSPMGNISYPQAVTGWYWSPEVAVCRQWCEITGATMSVEEAWVYEPGNDDLPFGFIEPLYNKRRALKKACDGSHVGIKLALNSLYGKLAQQVGWEPARAGKPARIPPFHQLEWAGYVTSHARAQILAASLPCLDSVIAYETDAVFSSSPLPVALGTGLGEWEATRFTSLTYVQSGLYFGTLADGTAVARTRGVDRGSLTRPDVVDALGAPAAVDRVARASLSRFVGAGIGLTQSFDRWGTWETTPKVIQLTPQGKRTHEYGCRYCNPDSVGETLQVWHETLCPRFTPGAAESAEFPVEWINPNPRMQAALLRERGAEDKESVYEEGA